MKQEAGIRAANLVENGMKVGLGTGSTTAFALEHLGKRIQEEGLQIVGIPTSFSAEQLAKQHGIPLASFDEIERLDIALDGADEVCPQGNLIKGRGAAHTREKIVAARSDRFVILIDESKLVDKLGTKMPLPIEVVPMAAPCIIRELAKDFGAITEIRLGKAKDGPVISDQGLWILDATFPNGIQAVEILNDYLNNLTGVLDHGLFLGLATDLVVGDELWGIGHR
jgi:ribose 5-phosphate isomerase A